MVITTSISNSNSRQIGGRVPTRRDDDDEEDDDFREQCQESAEIAMRYYNKHALERGETTYELVDIGFCSAFRGPWKENCFHFHCNFEAKPKRQHNSTESQSETLLFFAELREDYDEPIVATRCCILGPAGHGSNGCKACGPESSMQHPADGDFYVGMRQSFLTPRHLLNSSA